MLSYHKLTFGLGSQHFRNWSCNPLMIQKEEDKKPKATLINNTMSPEKNNNKNSKRKSIMHLWNRWSALLKRTPENESSKKTRWINKGKWGLISYLFYLENEIKTSREKIWCMHIYVQMYLYDHVYVHLSVCICVYLCVFMCVYMPLCVCMYLCVFLF